MPNAKDSEDHRRTGSDSESPPTPEPVAQGPGDPADAGASDSTVPPDDTSTPADPNATVVMSPEEIAALDEHPSDPDDPLIGTLMRGKWRVLSRIGAGSFGTVYKVRDENGGWIEALKILSVDRMQGPEADNMRKRFLREAQIMKRLGKDSKHIVGLSTYEEDLEAGQIYFLMEHVEGHVLSDVIQREGTFGVQRAVRLGLQVCDALMAAHEGPEPVVHRDLKLENLMLTTDRNGEEMVKVLDFGIAKIAEQEADSRLTTVGTLGTPGYAAPEQLRAEEVDGRTDLFAFGVILYSLLTGRNPWLGHLAHQPTKQTFELMAASDRAEVLPIEGTGTVLPPEVVAMVLKLLKRDPADRYQSARELREALLALSDQPGGTRGEPATSIINPISGPAPGTAGRRLAAVWFADLVGYSSLSSVDEAAALALLQTFHTTARQSIEAGGGRLVQFIGDAAFAEFTSTERSVRTAMDFRAKFAEATVDAEPTPLLRIGIHVGDVHIAADGDVFGDGVNTAARIQNAAEPGQVLVSSAVWGQLRQRRDFIFSSVGEHSLKGLGNPLELFSVLDEAEAAAAGIERSAVTQTLDRMDRASKAPSGRPTRSKAPLVAVGAVVLLGLGYVGYVALGPGDDPVSGGEPATTNDGSASLAQTDGGNDAAAATGPESNGEAGAGQEVGATPPATPPPEQLTRETTGAADPQADARARYAELSTEVGTIRGAASIGAHASLLHRLGEADALWNSAQNSAGAGRHDDAVLALDEARPLYARIASDNTTLRGLEADRSALAPLRRAALDDDLVSQADAAEAEADRAIADERYAAAKTAFDRATRLLQRAATAPDVQAPPPARPEAPVLVPAEVATDVLGRLRDAMEAEDMSAVRAVWTSITPDEILGLETFFNGVSQLRVEHRVLSTSTRGSRVVVTLETTYRFREQNDPFPGPSQTFELEQSGNEWRIVQSRVSG